MSNIWQNIFRRVAEALERAGDPDSMRVTYYPSDGAPVSNVIVSRIQLISDQPAGFETQIQTKVITFEAALDDLGKDPEIGEQFLGADDTIYTISAILESDGHTTTVQVTT
jgi:hypothetical protein